MAHDRSEPAGKIDAEHLIVRIGRYAVAERQDRRIVDPNDADVVRRIGGGIGVGQVDAIAVEQPRGVDVKTARDGRSADCGARQRLRHRRGEPVELILRLNQHIVPHVEQGGNLAGPDRFVGNQIERRPTRRYDRNRAEVTFGRIGIP